MPLPDPTTVRFGQLFLQVDAGYHGTIQLDSQGHHAIASSGFLIRYADVNDETRAEMPFHASEQRASDRAGC